MKKKTKRVEETNKTAKVALIMSICGLLFGPTFYFIGFVLGIIALKQIEKTGENGKGLATASVIIGVVFIIFFCILLSVQ